MMALRGGLLAMAVLMGVLLASALPARAALNLCNRTSYILYAATAALDGGGKAAIRGWTRIVPGECVAARSGNLSRMTYLVHARSSIAHSGAARAWGGNRQLCVRDGDFTLTQPAAQKGCGTDGAFPLGFAVVATEGQPDWTMTFDQQPELDSLQDAQLAGVRRLLKDNGYKVGAITGEPDKATGAALAQFRKTMKFPPDAGNDRLFTALETRAREHVAPAGLTACNDGKAPLLVALGQTGHGRQTARGWWTVAPGACARLQTIPLAADRMYLLAQTRDGQTVKGGSKMFCIADAAFEIGDAVGRCAARGYAEAGFAAIDAHGAAGAILHLGGAAPAPAAQKR